MHQHFAISDCLPRRRYYLSDDYKRTVLEHMSTNQLLDMLLIHPTVHVSPSYRDTGLTASYTFKPLSNLVGFCDSRWLSGGNPGQCLGRLEKSSTCSLGVCHRKSGSALFVLPFAMSASVATVMLAKCVHRDSHIISGVHEGPADHDVQGHCDGAAALLRA